MYKNKAASFFHASPQVLRGQIEFLSKHGAVWFWGHCFTASLFVCLRWIGDNENLALLTLWYAALLIVAGLRWFAEQQFYSDQHYSMEELQEFAQRDLIYSTLSSALWGVSGVVLFSQNVMMQAMHIILLAGVMVSSLPVLILSRSALYLQISVILLPSVLNLLLLAEGEHQATALALLVLGGLMGLASYALAYALSELNANQVKMQEQAHTDQVTQLPNRRYFDNTFKMEWRRMAREEKQLSLLMIDVDHFKRYNDKHGHFAGDQCLQTVGRCIQGIARRASDIVARHGGEEFVVLLPDTSLDDAMLIAERLRKSVEDQGVQHNDGAFPRIVTISIGVSCCVPPPPHRSGSAHVDVLYPAMLLNAADRALYRAKRSGRNQVSSEMCGQVATTHGVPLSLPPNLTQPSVVHAA